MNTRLIVRPQPQLRVSTECSSGFLSLSTDGPQAVLRVGSILTLQLDGAEAVQCTIISDDGAGNYLTDIACGTSVCPGGIGLANGSGPLFTYVQTSSGYLTYSIGGVVTTVGSGNPADVLGPIESGPGDAICLFSTDGSGAPDGSLLTFIDASGAVLGLNLSNAGSLTWIDCIAGGFLSPPDFSFTPLMQTLGLQEWPFATIDLSPMPLLESFSAQSSALPSSALQYLDLSGNPAVWYVYCPGAALISTDDTVNSINAATPNGTLDLSGGTSAPRTSASDTNYNALIANGWSILTN